MWLRIRQIALVARDLDAVTADLTDVLGVEVCFRDPGVGVFGLHNALFPVGNQFLEVVAPVQPNTTAERYLDRRRGDGGYMVITQCDEHAPRRRRVEELGVRIVHYTERPEVTNMQLHPRDVGGTLFEIDEQRGAGAHDPDGLWTFAGGERWRQFKHTEVVDGITAAELQVDDPAATARRWTEIVELRLEQDSRGRPVIPLDNGNLRFVAPEDGRGEGLGGIDLRVVDRDRLLAAAQKRGIRIGPGEDYVNLCGMRMYLR